MFYLIYKITNNLNGKIYIGSHKTKDINDEYMGSGKYLKNSISKNGIENFTKEILFVFDNPKDMYDKEAELVNDVFLSENNTYNLKKGGYGGFDFINKSGLNNKVNQCSTAGKKSAIKGGGFCGRKHSENTKKHLSDVLMGRPGTFNGRSHSKETKQKMSQSQTGNQKGNKNSQYGTMWLTNGIKNIKVRKNDLDVYLNLGYYKGRIIKNFSK